VISVFISRKFLFCFLLAFISAPYAQAQILITEGASPVMPYLKAMSGPFGKETGMSLNIKGNGSKAGVECLMKSECQIGFYIGQPSKEAEAALDMVPFAADALVVVTSSDVGIDGLTKDKVIEIFTGKIKNWKELGGKDASITVWQRRKASGIFDWFGKAFSLPSGSLAAKQEVGSANEMLFQMKLAKNTITYGSLSETLSPKAENFKLMKIDGSMPSEKTLQDGSYPHRQFTLMMRRKDQMNNEQINKLANLLMKNRQSQFKNLGMVMP
jgi:phosphate transport system substrate-binding protein